MTPHPAHHPADDILLRHAADGLPPGHALVVAAHLRFCSLCRDAVRLGEAAGGVMLSGLPGVPLSPDALERTLARLGGPAAEAPPPAPVQVHGVALPAALRVLRNPRWQWIAPGISRIVMKLPGASPTARTWLLRVAPGRSLPSHGHGAWEATCVLSGGFRDRTGVYGPGDVAEMDEEGRHRPVAEQDAPCVCLIAWDGGLLIRGLMGRVPRQLLGF